LPDPIPPKSPEGVVATAESPKPPAPAAAPAPPATAPPAPAVRTPLEMIPDELRLFLSRKLESGDPITIEARKETFTGRIFRLNLEEGWIAMEHEDGRRRAVYVIEGGRVTDGETDLPLGGAAAAGHK
jgi:hypothetical protein